MSAVRCPWFVWKLPHFQIRTVRKHFHQYVCLPDCSERQHKCMKFSSNSTQINGILHLNISWFRQILFLCLYILWFHLIQPVFRTCIEIFDSCWEHRIFHIPEYVPLALLQFCQFYFQPFPLSDTFSESPVVLSDFSCRNEILCACPLPVPMRAGIYKGMIPTWFGCLSGIVKGCISKAILNFFGIFYIQKTLPHCCKRAYL